MIIAPIGFQDYFFSYGLTTLDGYRLDDANDAIGYIYCLPKDGTITHIGIYMTQKNGTVPDYNIGLTTIDTAGAPTTTAYGNGANQTISPSTMDVGWYWIELNTPVTNAQQGDIVAIHIWPTGTAPTSSNFAEFAWDDIFQSNLPRQHRFTTSWSAGTGIPSSGLKYSDETVVGFPITAMIYESLTSTDEYGVYFQFPFELTCNGATIHLPSDFGGSEAFDIILYDSVDTVLASVSISDINIVDFGLEWFQVRWEDTVLSSGTPYRLVIKSTTANAIYGVGVVLQNSSYYSQFMPTATTWIATYRTGAGSWTNQVTHLPWIGLSISSISAGEVPVEGGGDTGFVW